MTRRWSAGLALAAIVVAACGLLPEPGPVVVVPPGLTPRMTPEQVSQQVIERIHEMEAQAGRVVATPKVLRIAATTRVGVGIVWRVTAEGTFTTNHGPLGVAPPVAGSGHWVIADADGGVLEFGFP
jgi:hypothetical protein